MAFNKFLQIPIAHINPFHSNRLLCPFGFDLWAYLWKCNPFFTFYQAAP